MAGNHFGDGGVEQGADDTRVGFLSLCHSDGKSAEKLSAAWD